MKLTKALITNYRGINGSQEFLLSDFNTIIGKNDAGKSTLLKALDLFFANSSFKIEDKNVFTEDDFVAVELFFETEEIEIVIDEAIHTTFEQEELVNSSGFLQIKKEWDVSKPRKTYTAITSIRRKIYNENDFIPMSETALIKLCSDTGIETQKANGGDYHNVEKREKLRSKCIEQDIEFEYEYEILPTTGSNRLKKIHEQIKDVLPKFQYFKADTSLSESDITIQNYFRDKAQKIIDSNILKKEALEKLIHEQLDSVLGGISDKINEVLSNDDKIEPEIKFEWDKLVKTSFKSPGDEDKSIPLTSRGDGFRRITMMSYFEYLAEEGNSEEDNLIFGFEEPETFLHPSSQEKLFERLKTLSEKGYQIIISTHSPILVANSEIDSLTHIVKNGQNIEIQQNDLDIKYIADDLGINVKNQFISIFDTARHLFLVEGITDVNALNLISELYKVNNKIENNFDDLNVVILPIGGCNSMKHWVALDLLTKFDKPFFIYLDSDKLSPTMVSQNRLTLIDYGYEEGVDFLVTRKRELENYIPPAALNRLVSGAALSYSDFDDVKYVCDSHPLRRRLGCAKVLNKHYNNITFEEWESMFNDGTTDEFIEVYNAIVAKL